MCSQNEVDDVHRNDSTCIYHSKSGGIDVQSDVCTATEIVGNGWDPNVCACWGPVDAESTQSRTNDSSLGSSSIDGGRQSKEEYESRGGLGEHPDRKKKGWMVVSKNSSRVSKIYSHCVEPVGKSETEDHCKKPGCALGRITESQTNSMIMGFCRPHLMSGTIRESLGPKVEPWLYVSPPSRFPLAATLRTGTVGTILIS
jgi:hypothetical protein